MAGLGLFRSHLRVILGWREYIQSVIPLEGCMMYFIGLSNPRRCDYQLLFVITVILILHYWESVFPSLDLQWYFVARYLSHILANLVVNIHQIYHHIMPYFLLWFLQLLTRLFITKLPVSRINFGYAWYHYL